MPSVYHLVEEKRVSQINKQQTKMSYKQRKLKLLTEKKYVAFQVCLLLGSCRYLLSRLFFLNIQQTNNLSVDLMNKQRFPDSSFHHHSHVYFSLRNGRK